MTERLPELPLHLKAELLHELVVLLQDARQRLIDWIGTDCECDNTHQTVGTVCCLCEYQQAIDRANSA